MIFLKQRRREEPSLGRCFVLFVGYPRSSDLRANGKPNRYEDGLVPRSCTPSDEQVKGFAWYTVLGHRKLVSGEMMRLPIYR